MRQRTDGRRVGAVRFCRAHFFEGSTWLRKHKLITWTNGRRGIDLADGLAAVSGDGAYDTRGCHAAIAGRGAIAVIPTRKHGKPWKKQAPGVQARNAILSATMRLGSRIWKAWSSYHRPSLVETKMHCFKRLGERVMARTFERQVVELHVRVALLNRLGRPVTVAVA